MANTTPIQTDTKIEKVKIDGDMAQVIKKRCDELGAAGYVLTATFTLGENHVVLIFQLTR